MERWRHEGPAPGFAPSSIESSHTAGLLKYVVAIALPPRALPTPAAVADRRPIYPSSLTSPILLSLIRSLFVLTGGGCGDAVAPRQHEHWARAGHPASALRHPSSPNHDGAIGGEWHAR